MLFFNGFAWFLIDFDSWPSLDLWFSYDFHIDLWFFNGFARLFNDFNCRLWFSYGFHMDLYGFSMVLQCFRMILIVGPRSIFGFLMVSIWIYMVFQWFCKVFE